MAYFCRQGWVFVILLSGPAAFQDVIVVNRKNTEEVNTAFYPNPLEDESDAQTEILTAAAGRDVFFPLNFTFLLRACDKENCRSS